MHTHPLADGEAPPVDAHLTTVGDVATGKPQTAVMFPIAEASRTHIHLPDEVFEQEYNDYRRARMASGQDDEYGSPEEYVAVYLRRLMGRHSREVTGLSADHPGLEAHLRSRFGVTQGISDTEPTPTTPSHEESADLVRRYHTPPLEERKPVSRGSRLQLVPPATPAFADPEDTL
jgi:hypothetical protein